MSKEWSAPASPQTPGERAASREKVRAEAVRDAADPAAVAEVERCVRAYVAGDESIVIGLWSLAVLMTEYDRRGAALASGDAAPTPGYLVASIRAKAADEAIGMCCEGTGECGIDDCRSDSARLSGLVDAADYVAALAARSPRPETAQPGADDLSLYDAAMKAAVRARDEWRAAVEGPMAGHPDDPECIAIAEAVLAAVQDHGAAARSPREESAETAKAGEIRAPFTSAQQQALYDWQNNPRWHPFTCANGHGTLAVGRHWYCTECDYTQYWAHAFMAAPAETTEETT